jgi:hypothetical protein
MKFHKRGLFKDNAHKASALSILRDIVKRGFKDEDDFSDQCASVSESFESVNAGAVGDLFDLLVDRNGR